MSNLIHQFDNERRDPDAIDQVLRWYDTAPGDEPDTPTPSDRRWCIAVLTVGAVVIGLLLVWPQEALK